MSALSLSPCLYFANKLQPVTQFILTTASKCPISVKIQAAATGLFNGCTSLYLCGFGTMELGQTIKKTDFPEKLIATEHKVINASSAYLNLHGGLMLGSGTFGLMDTLQGFGVVDFCNFAQAVSAASCTLFLCANIVGLDESVRLLNELMNTDWSKTNINDQELKWLKQSAFWGILNNLGYILTSASLLLGGATAITILLAALSCCAGGVKILFDLLLWAKKDSV